MAKYPLQPLLSVRKYREDAAQTQLRQAEHALREAKEQLETREKELADFALWRREEEDRRYASIMHTLLSLDELDQFKAALARLRDKELLHEEQVIEARHKLEQARKDVEKAKDTVRLAQRETARILAHKDIWLEAERKEAERKEDLESEEFKPMSVDAVDES